MDSGVRFGSSNSLMLPANIVEQLHLRRFAADAEGRLCCATLPPLTKKSALFKVE